MSKNAPGVLNGGHMEWGRKARKAEARERGLDAKGARQAIAEQLDDIEAQ